MLSLPARATPGLGKDSCTWNNDKDSVALSLVSMLPGTIFDREPLYKAVARLETGATGRHGTASSRLLFCKV